MAVRVKIRKLEIGIVILHLSGSLTATEIDQLETTFQGLLSEPHPRVIFDLAGIEEIDAPGSLFCVRCFFAARQAGGELRFAAATPEVSRPFKRAMLDSLLPFEEFGYPNGSPIALSMPINVTTTTLPSCVTK